jgi:Ni,Fe-hydrogenase III large subunit
MSYTLALGPFDTNWRGPLRLVLTLEGEVVTDVAYEAGYNERGCAERIPRLNLEQALHLVSRICGSDSHAHTLAFCQALEALLGLTVPERAAYLRCAVAELERLTSHLLALTTLFDMLGQARYADRLRKLSEGAQQAMLLLTGTRGLPNICLPGGVRQDLEDEQRSELLTVQAKLNRRLFSLIDRTIDERALLARTVNVGAISTTAAAQFGLRGPLGRGSGLTADLRLEQPYAAYEHLGVRLVVQDGGDVYARLVVLLLEALESGKLVEQAIERLPTGDWQGTLPNTLVAGSAEAAVESPHGLLQYRLESDGRRITGAVIDPPHQLDRLLARTLLIGALLDNVPLIVSSTDPCVACVEC